MKRRVVLIGIAASLLVILAMRTGRTDSAEPCIPPKPSPIARYEGPILNPDGAVVAHLFLATPWLDWGDVFWIRAVRQQSGDYPILLSGYIGTGEEMREALCWKRGGLLHVEYFDASGRPRSAVIGPLEPAPLSAIADGA